MSGHKLVAMTFEEASQWIASQEARIVRLEAALRDISTIYPKELFPAVTALAYCRQRAIAALSGARTADEVKP